MNIPADILDGWEDAGSTLRSIIQHVGIGADDMEHITEATGLDAEGPAVDLAYIRDDEWEELIVSLRVNGNPANIFINEESGSAVDRSSSRLGHACQAGGCLHRGRRGCGL